MAKFDSSVHIVGGPVDDTSYQVLFHCQVCSCWYEEPALDDEQKAALLLLGHNHVCYTCAKEILNDAPRL